LARAGEISAFTGVSDPYEAPLSPALEVRTDQLSVEQAVDRLLAELVARAGGDNSYGFRTRAPLNSDPAISMHEISRRLGVAPRTLAARLRATARGDASAR
jgi:AraC-like DNA-binding protein